jgi:ElaB/YqjD/DUF883 family membrane-anchored ribosome-binding protein
METITTQDVRHAIAKKLERAEDMVRDVEVGAVRKVRFAARGAEHYAHRHPWHVAAIGLALVAVFGVAIGVVASRK